MVSISYFPCEAWSGLLLWHPPELCRRDRAQHCCAVSRCRYQQAELQNGRWAMLGTAGVLFPELLSNLGTGGPAAQQVPRLC